MLLPLACVVLALGPLAVFAGFDSISFSPVQQCGNFTVNFSGGKPPSALPLTLTVVPFNSTPVFIEIPNSDWDDATLTGAAITFLPFAAGTSFVASLDDASGTGTGPVSDTMTVDTSDNSTCLHTNTTSSAPRYTIDGTLAQCEPFSVLYDKALVDAPPTIRAFVPKNISTPVNLTVWTPGNASYTMDVLAGEQVVLLLSDDTGFHQTTDLVLVKGTGSSPTSCLAASAATSQTSAAAASSGGLSTWVLRVHVIEALPHL